MKITLRGILIEIEEAGESAGCADIGQAVSEIKSLVKSNLPSRKKHAKWCDRLTNERCICCCGVGQYNEAIHQAHKAVEAL